VSNSNVNGFPIGPDDAVALGIATVGVVLSLVAWGAEFDNYRIAQMKRIASEKQAVPEAVPVTINPVSPSLDNETTSSNDVSMVLYHYSMSPTWRGSILTPGSFLTDNPNYNSSEARSKLALPNVPPGTKLHIYQILVKPGEVTPPRTVQPMKNNITNRVLHGGGVEYINIKPLVMPPTGVAVPP